MIRADDTMNSYETGVDSGDQNEDSAQVESPAPVNDNPDSTPSAPIPQAEPQSPVQTEDSPNISPSKDVHEHSGERGAGNLSGQDAGSGQGESDDHSAHREYREVKSTES